VSEQVAWSELRAEHNYWVRPPYAEHTYPATFLGWNLDNTEASFVVHYGEGNDRPTQVSPHGGWEVYDGRPEEPEGHSGNDQSTLKLS
jgi:hypothetical protein